MGKVPFDRELAAAESRLLRLDEAEEEPPADRPRMHEAEVTGEAGMHVEDGDALEVLDENEEAHPFDTDEVAELIDAFAECFNARDLDGVLEVVAEDLEAPGLGEDRASLPGALEDLWDQHPTVVLVRGHLDGEPLGMLFEVGDDGRWWRLAPLVFDGVVAGRLVCLELVDDPDLVVAAVADPPDEDVEEGLTWTEWEQGVPD